MELLEKVWKLPFHSYTIITYIFKLNTNYKSPVHKIEEHCNKSNNNIFFSSCMDSQVISISNFQYTVESW